MAKKKLTIKDITVDDALRHYLPARSPAEDEELRKAVLDDKEFTDPLIVWGTANTLIDGYGRYDLWKSLSKKSDVRPPRVETIAGLADLDAVKLWMLRRQLGRRNLSPQAMSLLRGMLYREVLKQPNFLPGLCGEAQNEPEATSQGENNHPAATAVAEMYGVSQSTVRRDADYLTAVEAIGKVNSRARIDIEAGIIDLPKADVIEIGKLPAEEIARCLKDIRMGFDWRDGQKPAPEPSTNGQAIPDRLQAVFASIALIKAASAALKKAHKALQAAEASAAYQAHDLANSRQNRKRFRYSTLALSAAGIMDDMMPKEVCPACHGIEASEDNELCALCEGKGYLSEEDAKS